MNEKLYLHKDNEQLTPEIICELLSILQLEYDAKDKSMIQIEGSNGWYVIFTDNLPWLTISRPATVADTRDISILKKAIEQYDLIMVKCRLINKPQGGYGLEFYLESIEQTYGHFRDSLGSFIYLLDRAFKELSELYEKLSVSTESH